MKKQVKYISAGMLAGMLLCGGQMQAANTMSGMHVCVTDAIQKDNRPEVSKRLFRSNAVEKEILRVQKLLKNEKLAWMFTNCFPNTIDTTVHFRKGEDGKPDTFVYTGDIHAMWLRDSGAQVWPYVQLANSDPELKEMLAARYEVVYAHEEQLRLSFSSPLDVLKHLKETGVTGTAAQPWTRGRLQEFCRNYTRQFSDERGKVYLTFHPIYMICRK